MIRAISEGITLDEFLDWYPDGYGRYELRNGAVIEMQPTGTHEQVAGFLAQKLSVEIDRLSMHYLIPRQAIIKLVDSDKSGFNPDVIVLDRKLLEAELLWRKRSIITQGETVRLVIEVVSTNWQDDYLIKLGEYERLGIAEYWIVDYLRLGGRRYIGNPKQATVTVCEFVEGEYRMQMFRDSDRIISSAFPELTLTAEQIFEAGK